MRIHQPVLDVLRDFKGANEFDATCKAIQAAFSAQPGDQSGLHRIARSAVAMLRGERFGPYVVREER